MPLPERHKTEKGDDTKTKHTPSFQDWFEYRIKTKQLVQPKEEKTDKAHGQPTDFFKEKRISCFSCSQKISNNGLHL